MSAFVAVTFRGRRFHTSYCDAQDAGRGLWWNRYEVRWLLPEQAARAGYTACRVCVPPALALPATGETYGHERLTVNPSCCGDDCCGYRTEQTVCGRCSDDVTRHDGAHWALSVPWPCTSALVLGLVPRDPR